MVSDQPQGRDGEAAPSPAQVAYRELVYEHARRLYEVAILLIEDQATARDSIGQALRRLWRALERGDLLVEPEELLYRSVVRDAVQRLAKSKQLRGYQPPTTGDDRHITAVGILDSFAPEQRAAILLAAWGGLGYRLAGVASGLGEARARDLCLAARQEYYGARYASGVQTGACGAMAPLLSAAVDAQLRERERSEMEAHLAGCVACRAAMVLYEDFSAGLRELRLPEPEVQPLDQALSIPQAAPERPAALRRLVQLATGPALLVVVLLAGLFLFRWCEPPPVTTGRGRTPDLVYAQPTEGEGIVVLESGSGRELGRLPGGELAPNGWWIYSTTVTCGEAGCRTAITVTDTGTRQSRPLGEVEGRVQVIGSDGRGERIYLVGEEGAWGQLVAYGVEDRRVVGVVQAPEELAEGFNPRAHVTMGAALFTLGRLRTTGGLAVLGTDLASLAITGWVALDGPEELGVGMAPAPDGRRVFVYLPAGPVLYEVDPSAGRPVGALRLQEEAPPQGGAYLPQDGTVVAIDPGAGLLYCLLPTGGVAVVRESPLSVIRELAADQRYRSIGTSSDGLALYALGFDGSYAVLDALTGQPLRVRSGVLARNLLQVAPGE